jgi:2-polyprenyl-3-methyl-5-hydroxy-6-metoxy-1,4-benzoquinol methylase
MNHKLRQALFARGASFSTANQSVRNKEVEFFRSIQDWWSPSGPQAQLHRFNKVRVNFIRRNIL